MKTSISALLKSAWIGVFAVLAASCSPETEHTEPATTPGDIVSPSPVATVTGADYSNMNHWLCHADKENDACSGETTVSIVGPNSVSRKTIEVAETPEYDCFYIYPTISLDATPNSDLTPGPFEELYVVRQQLPLFKDQCRLFAPMYRQLTLAELNRFMTTGELTGDMLVRYLDVKNAWEHYLAHHNEGRGVVLMGHSQGAAMIQELLAKHINHTAEIDLIVSAAAIGFNTPVAPDGTAFNMGLPICQNADQAGCMISWSSFRDTLPPADDAFFGKALPAGVRQACTNPADLLGSETGAITPILPSQPLGLFTPFPYYDGAPVDAAFVDLPGMLSASCTSNDTHDWLSITVAGDESDKRTDDIPGDLMTDNAPDPAWGLHPIDMNIAAGDLKLLFERQYADWVKRFAEE